jgi:hypothetical protein
LAIYDKYSLNYSNPITVDNNTHRINLSLQEATVPNYVLMGKVYYMQQASGTPIVEVPISGARIMITAIPTYSNTIYSDNNGYYHVELPNGGPFLITVSAATFVTTRVSVSIPVRIPILKNFNLSKNLSYGNIIYGIISDADAPNTLINNANLYISNTNDPSTIIKATTSTDNGEYSLYDLADGIYTIRAYANGYNSKSENIQPLSSAATAEKNIQLTPYVPAKKVP